MSYRKSGGDMTTSFNRTESARWAAAVNKTVGKLEAVVDKALAENAARGFPEPTGPTLEAILKSTLEAQSSLTEENGKIYEDQRERIFQQEEFDMKVIVQIAKLAMELYRAELFNALEIEQAENIALRDQGRADVERMNSEVDARQVAIIRDRAEAERQIIVFKLQLALAEKQTLVAEVALINAQLATAEKKLEIIDSIYQVLAAEELVLAAERRRAATLETLLAAQRAVAAVKMSMVPFYTEKAAAREALASAITEEVPVKIAIENLGYQRIGLRTAEADVEHGVRQAEIEVEMAREAYARANAATEIARAQSQTLIQGFANAAQASIQAKRKATGMAEIDVRLSAHIGRAAIGVNNEVAVAAHEAGNLTTELLSIMHNLGSRASDEAGKVMASATQISKTDITHLLSRKIVEGLIVG